MRSSPLLVLPPLLLLFLAIHAFVVVVSFSYPTTFLGVKSIGVDYGLVRTGLAVTSGYSFQPLTIISETNATKLSQRISQICISEGATQIVLGLPLARNGTEDEQTKLTRDFARLLYCACIQRCGPMFTNVFLVDERYTSKLALARRRSASGTINNKLSTTKPSGSFVSSRWTRIDDDSACIILEDFYHSISTTTTSTRNFEKSEMIVSIPKETYQTCIAIWKQQQQLMQHARYNAQRERYSAVNAREEAMRRAKAMEETMKEEGLLGYTKKAQRKLKKQRRNAAPVTQKIE